VTRQLVRIPAEQFAECRRSVEALDDACSFRLLPPSDHLDLDWAPAPMIRLFELAQVDARQLAALRRSLDGDTEVNEAYRDHPETVWGHPVTGLDPEAKEAARRDLAVVLW